MPLSSSDFVNKDNYYIYLAILESGGFDPETQVYNGVSYNASDEKIQFGDDLTGSGQQGEITKNRFIWMPTFFLRFLESLTIYADIKNGGLDTTAPSYGFLYNPEGAFSKQYYGRLGVNSSQAVLNMVYLSSFAMLKIGDNSTPTARLHLKEGESGVGKATQKMDSGTLQVTPESGTEEFNGRFFKSFNSIRFAQIFKMYGNGIPINPFTSFTFTVNANTLNVNGDSLYFEIFGSIVSDAVNTGAISASFGGVSIYSSGAVIITNTDIIFKLKMVRSSNTVLLCHTIVHLGSTIYSAVASIVIGSLANNNDLAFNFIPTGSAEMAMAASEIFLNPQKQ